jgi:hypothetical protein
VIPNRQPIESSLIDKPPQAAQFFQRAVLLASVDTESERHDRFPSFSFSWLCHPHTAPESWEQSRAAFWRGLLRESVSVEKPRAI